MPKFQKQTPQKGTCLKHRRPWIEGIPPFQLSVGDPDLRKEGTPVRGWPSLVRKVLKQPDTTEGPSGENRYDVK